MKKQKIVGTVISALVFAGIMTSCGNEKDFEKLLDKNDPVTITVWHYYNGVQQVQFDEMVAEFNDTIGSEKGIYVEAFSKNSINELAESVIAAVNKEAGSEEAPDIFGTYVETAYQIDKMGKLVDLNQYLTKDDKSEFVEEYLQEGAFHGDDSLMIFPTAKGTEVMMLNLTDWEKFSEAEGISYEDLSTWEGLAKTAEKYYSYTDGLTPDVENDGKAFFGRDSVANYMSIGAQQLGHTFTKAEKDGSVSVEADRETLRKLWDNFYVPFVKGFYAADSRFRSDDVKIGSIISLICSTSGATYYPNAVTINDDYTYPIENVVLHVPNFAGTEPCIVQQGAGMSVLQSDTQSEYASVVFLKWLTEEEHNIEFAVNAGYLPVKKNANDFTKISASDAAANIDQTTLKALEVSIEEMKSYDLYTAPPFDQSAQVREYIGTTMEETAKEAHTAAMARIEAGEDRETVLEEFTNDAAFDSWYENFDAGLHQIANEKAES